MALSLKKATREKTKARIALAGPAGAGKTRWALEIAMILAGPQGKVAVLDTENESASLYVGVNGIEFDTCNLNNFAIQNYLDAIALFEREKYDVVVIDSMSHAWAGEGGALEQVDKIKGNNAFTNGWGTVTPLQNKLTNAITQCKSHLICTLQQHQEYVLEERTNPQGRKVQTPVRKGLAAVQRKGTEYIFSIYAEVDLDDHGINVTKSRLDPIKNGKFSTNELKHFAEQVKLFHESGATPAAIEPEAPTPPPVSQPEQRRPATQPDRTESAEPEKLPTTTSQNYQNKQYAKVPWGSLPTSELAAYIAHYEQKLREDDNAKPEDKVNPSHRHNAVLSLKAAQKEYEARASVEDEFRGAPPDMDRPQAQAD